MDDIKGILGVKADVVVELFPNRWAFDDEPDEGDRLEFPAEAWSFAFPIGGPSSGNDATWFDLNFAFVDKEYSFQNGVLVEQLLGENPSEQIGLIYIGVKERTFQEVEAFGFHDFGGHNKHNRFLYRHKWVVNFIA